jgi:hypothetical protein
LETTPAEKRKGTFFLPVYATTPQSIFASPPLALKDSLDVPGKPQLTHARRESRFPDNRDEVRIPILTTQTDRAQRWFQQFHNFTRRGEMKLCS